ncbi:MAG: peptidoglycan editing factor PgeF [Sulfurimonas sp.]|uniref:peptidoglycan editing factor PgeF n=1 Tax=Sulfurimonas sp. TaxID=2022749 RepID=UPI0025E117FA|nr:peptidoglycan editing factor PgeF [Sulfurimonas sp.]MCK9491663.1 peptidoglycan editing factor PgeF [Sulfurimonas sp.]
MKIDQSPRLKKDSKLIHAFTTRNGGSSKAPYNSLNLAFHVGDNIDSVLQNHKILASRLNYKKETLVHMKQIHSSTVHIVEKQDDFSNPPTCDALITNKTNIPLMVMVADCSPLLFYDESKRVIAVAHAGREGAFQNIAKNVVDSFVKDFGSDAKGIVVTIGATIGVCCYEVGHEIGQVAQELDLGFAMDQRGDSLFLDLTKILKSQLLTSGIKEQNIEISKECSCCKESKYFSYRSSKETGRFAGVIMMLD